MVRLVSGRMVLLLVLPTVSVVLLAWFAQVASANPPESAFSEVNGVRSAITVGQAIAQGEPVQGGASGADRTLCNMPEMRLSQTLRGSINRGTLRVEITEDCRAVVRLVNSYYDPDPPQSATDPPETVSSDGHSGSTDSSDGDVTRYRSWAKSELNDPPQFGIDLLSAYAHVLYDDDGERVSNGSSRGDKCGYFPITGWYVITCVGTGSFSGPSEIWKATSSHGNNSLVCQNNCLLWHRAKTTARPGRSIDYSCIQAGPIPWGTHWECHGTRVN